MNLNSCQLWLELNYNYDGSAQNCQVAHPVLFEAYACLFVSFVLSFSVTVKVI